jgi:hypothetical protein
MGDYGYVNYIQPYCRPRSYLPPYNSVKELDWRGLAAAFKSTPADVILGGVPGALLDIQLSV